MNPSSLHLPRSSDAPRGENTRIGATPNPFCTRFIRPGAIPFRFSGSESADVSDEDQLVGICQTIESQSRSLIVGPHGSGKSTLVQALLKKLEHAFERVVTVQLCAQTIQRSGNPLSWLSYYWKRQSELASNRKAVRIAAQELSALNGLLIVDGIEQLTWFAQKELFRTATLHGVSILGTAHRDLPSFSTVYATSLSTQMIRQLTNDCVVDCPEPTRVLVRHELEQRDLSEVQNLRDFWFELYDLVADADRTGLNESMKQ